jgi:hypothetical protein
MCSKGLLGLEEARDGAPVRGRRQNLKQFQEKAKKEWMWYWLYGRRFSKQYGGYGHGFTCEVLTPSKNQSKLYKTIDMIILVWLEIRI